MASSEAIEAPAEIVRTALDRASRGLVGREALVELVALAAVAREHVLVVGPPGTAKSEAVRRVARVFGGRYFEYLLGRFTEPSELFGPVDLKRLREGTVETETKGMLPEADLAFLDEVFLGSTAILNTLLGILNERRFRRGHTELACPLRVCVGATNSIPEEDTLAAFADRFLVRVFVQPVPDPELEILLSSGWSLEQQLGEPVGLEALDQLAEQARAANLDAVRLPLAHALRLLRKNGLPLSDRRSVKVQKLMAASAVLAGRATPSEADLWPLVYAVPTEAAQRVAREALRELLAASENKALSAATEEASYGPLARATRLVEAAERLFTEKPTENLQAWQLKLEGIAREIDASFAEDQRTAAINATRAKIVALLEQE